MKRKYNLKIILNKILFLVSLIVFLICIIHIVLYIINSNNTKKQTKKINKDAEIIETNKNAEIINTNDDKNNPYWYFIKMNLIDVDLTKLKKENNDTVGWIQIKGTNINYPFVQTNNNDYYLSHSFNKSINDAGWIFLDYRNDINDLEKNTIIYGHGRYDKTMFGTLKNVFNNDWLKDEHNYVINMSTEKYSTMWQVFSVYKIKTTTDYLKINFTDNEFNSFIDMIKNRSDFNFNTSVKSSDNILTLSTCYDENSKVVLHAKLIKKIKK